MPGPTEPNRYALLSGTSHGVVANSAEQQIEGLPQRTIFDQLSAADVDFKIYYGDFPASLFLRRVREYADRLHTVDELFDDIASGELPSFAWLEPRYFSLLDWKEQDGHPHHNQWFMDGSTAPMTEYVGALYNALAASPAFNDTLLFIVFDEHGGMLDHVKPPHNVPAYVSSGGWV